MTTIASGTPPGVLESANSARSATLPEKSRAAYDRSYAQFWRWHEMKQIQSKYTSENVFLGFFRDMAEIYEPNTLWSMHSKLKAEFIAHEHLDIDTFSAVNTFLSAKSRKYVAKKSATFTRDQVNAYLRASNANIAYQLIFAFGVFGGCRKSELVDMSPDDIKETPDGLEICIPKGKTGARWFMITKNPDLDIVALYHRYKKLRPTEKAPADRFFLRYVMPTKDTNGNKCTTQPIGKNKVGEIPR